jgi:hypothetical protein
VSRRKGVQLGDESKEVFIDNLMFYIIGGSLLFWKFVEIVYLQSKYFLIRYDVIII